jgi:hypothetical protein
LAVFVCGLLLSSQPVRAAAITVEGDAPLKRITVTIEGATLNNVVRELSQKYGFEAQGLDNMNSTAPLSATMSGSLRSVLEALLRNCNYLLVRSTDNKSGVKRVIILNCTGSALSPGRAQDPPTDTPQQQLLEEGRLDQLVAPIAPKKPPQIDVESPATAEAKFKAAQEKAKLSGVHTLTQEDIEGLSSEQIKELRGY